MNMKVCNTDSVASAPFRVLEVAPDPKMRFAGGPTAIAKSIMDWRDHFLSESICLEFFNSIVVDRAVTSQGKWTWQNIRSWFAFRSHLVRRVRRGEAIDLVHLHSSRGVAFLKDLLVSEEVAVRTKTRVVVHVHYAGIDDILPPNPVLAKMTMWLMRHGRAKYILLAARDEVDFARQSIDPSRLRTIPNFHFFEEIPEQCNNHKRTESQMQLLFIGSLGKRKGITDLIRALAGIDQNSYVLHVAGSYIDDETQAETERLIEELDIKSTIVFHGYISGGEKEALMRSTDVMLLPSYGEGMPVVILEAFSYGICVVTTDVGAISEVIEHECNGLLHQPGDIEALHSLILQMEQDRELLQRLKLGAYQSAGDYSPQSFRSQLMSVFKEWVEVN
jgi:glycosyltransferase involved in cell wall biosynthesis